MLRWAFLVYLLGSLLRARVPTISVHRPCFRTHILHLYNIATHIRHHGLVSAEMSLRAAHHHYSKSCSTYTTTQSSKDSRGTTSSGRYWIKHTSGSQSQIAGMPCWLEKAAADHSWASPIFCSCDPVCALHHFVQASIPRSVTA